MLKVKLSSVFHVKVKTRKVLPVQAICFQKVKTLPASMVKLAKT